MRGRLLGPLIALVFLVAPARADFSNPGVISLGDFQVGPPATQVTPQNLQQGLNLPGTPLPLSGLTALSCQATFLWVSGGSSVNVYIQSSLDQGRTWFDIANVAFGTSSGIEIINLSGLNSVTTPQVPSSLSLPNNTTFNGPLGDRLQAVVVSTGNYGAGTLASVRCALR